jgi:hypothetical protein
MVWHYRESLTELTGLALAALCLAACAGPPAVPAAEDPFGDTWSDRTVFEQAASDAGAFDGPAGATVYHIDIVIHPELDGLEGREWIRYTNREVESLDEIYLRLFANATGGSSAVSGLFVDGVEKNPVLEPPGYTLRIPLVDGLGRGETINLRLDFEVEFGEGPPSSYGVLGHFDDFVLLDGFYPVVLVFDDEGWNAETLVPIGDMSYLDAAFFLVRITAPRDLDLVASGTQIDKGRSGPNQVATFAVGPARDFYVAAAPDLESFSSRLEDKIINSYSHSEHSEGAELALRVAVEALALFEDRLGPYPYSEFDLIGTPMRSLGIEYPGMTTISLAMYDLDSAVADVPAPVMLEGTVVHEVAHQWFYNVVGNDQIDEPWLDEALAQYLTGLYYREVYGDQAEQDYRQSWNFRWARIGNEPIPIGLPTSGYSAEEYSPIVYGRGPLFVAALEDLMGRAEFAAFLRDYYRTNTWGIATGGDFRAVAEQHCGCDLGDMFSLWVDG